MGGGQAVGLQKGEVRPGIATCDGGLDRSTAGAHLDGVVALDDVVGGQHEIVAPHDPGGGPATAGVDANDTGSRSIEDGTDVTGQV